MRPESDRDHLFEDPALAFAYALQVASATQITLVISPDGERHIVMKEHPKWRLHVVKELM